ncbi:MAG TPA: DUF2127 domain-containing protein [Candidatus Limnocylindrales bacterium]|nr:DUF2127 domain-containing protein [Candidatus Limnocylindrales bacterium]
MTQHTKGFFVRHFGLRGIAVFEAGKGALALGVALWALTLLHKDMERVAEHLLEVLHIGLDRDFAQRVLRAAQHVTDRNILVFMSGIFVYSGVRFVEATGLWLEKEWAEWFALLSGGLYMPYEIFELLRKPTALKWGIFGVNTLIVLYLVWLLLDSHKRKVLAREQGLPVQD